MAARAGAHPCASRLTALVLWLPALQLQSYKHAAGMSCVPALVQAAELLSTLEALLLTFHQHLCKGYQQRLGSTQVSTLKLSVGIHRGPQMQQL